MTNIGPLSTVYTPPASCSRSTGWHQSWRTTVDTEGETISLYKDYKGAISIDECLPPGFNTRAGAYYSPGVCPSGYTSACSRPGDWANPSLTKVVCCLTGVMYFDCAEDLDNVVHKCGYNVTSGEGILNPLTVIQGGLETTSSSTVTDGFIHAFGIEVWSITETTTATMTEESTATGPTSATSKELRETQSITTSSSSSPPDAGGGSGGLDTGSVAGIAVGATVGGLLIRALLIFLFLRKRARDRDQPAGDGFMTPAGVLQPETKHNGSDYYGPVETQPPAEMAAWQSWPPPEMSATVQHPHELYSGVGRNTGVDEGGGAGHLYAR